MNSSHSVMVALGRARQRLADILTPDPSLEFDQAVGRLLGQMDDAAIIRAVSHEKGDEAASRLGEALAALRRRTDVNLMSREGEQGWTIQLRFATGAFTAEREFMASELDQVDAWIGRTLARAERGMRVPASDPG